MKTTALALGELVKDRPGKLGEVVGFNIDGVLIDWGSHVGRGHYTDAQLEAYGIERATEADVLGDAR